MDRVFEEFRVPGNIGNCLSRDIVIQRVFPALSVAKVVRANNVEEFTVKFVNMEGVKHFTLGHLPSTF